MREWLEEDTDTRLKWEAFKKRSERTSRLLQAMAAARRKKAPKKAAASFSAC